MSVSNIVSIVVAFGLLITVGLAFADGQKSCDLENGYDRYWVSSWMVPTAFKIEDHSSQWLCLNDAGYNESLNEEMISIENIGNYVVRAFADHTEVTISPASGSGAPGCEETADGCFIPSTATVDVGGVVIFSNTDTAAHTFTSGTPDDGPSGLFDTGLLMAGNSFEYSPDTAGEIPYFCMVHPWMIGTIIVGDNVIVPRVNWEDKYYEVLSDFNEVSNKVGELREENNELRAIIDTLEDKIENLNLLVREQYKVIYDWVLGK